MRAPRPQVSFHGAMRAGSNGAGFLPPLAVVFRVENRGGSVKEGAVWRDTWYPVGNDFKVSEFALQAADKQRAIGFVCRVRPVIVNGR